MSNEKVSHEKPSRLVRFSVLTLHIVVGAVLGMALFSQIDVSLDPLEHGLRPTLRMRVFGLLIYEKRGFEDGLPITPESWLWFLLAAMTAFGACLGIVFRRISLRIASERKRILLTFLSAAIAATCSVWLFHRRVTLEDETPAREFVIELTGTKGRKIKAEYRIDGDEQSKTVTLPAKFRLNGQQILFNFVPVDYATNKQKFTLTIFINHPELTQYRVTKSHSAFTGIAYGPDQFSPDSGCLAVGEWGIRDP